jgi:hypothetical protein
MRFPELLAESVRRLPERGQTHWLKTALSVNRLAERYPHWEQARFQQALERAGWDTAPQIRVLIHPSVQVAAAEVSVRQAQTHIGRQIFPLAYRSARSWYDQAGLAAVVNAYRGRAVHEGTYLGHGWTVWCSFFELVPHLHGEEERRFALERFVEFVAQGFPGFPSHDPNWAPPVRPDPGPIDLSGVLDACLERPGFFGHNLLTLGYFCRHREQLEEPDWRVGLATARAMALAEYIDPEDNVHMPPSAVPGMPVAEADLEAAILRLVLEGPANPHSITLADISYDLWQVADSRQRRHLLHDLRQFTAV